MLDTFRKPGRWLRVNTHTHTTHSDGGYTPAQAVAHYRDTLGYHALAITDHRTATPVEGLARDGDDFCILSGMEIDGVDPQTGLYHVVALGVTADMDFDDHTPLQAAVDWVNAHGGLAIFAHPYWTGQRHHALTTIENVIGVEVYNQVCLMDNGKAHSLSHWDALIEEGRRVWGIASDDTHFASRFGYGGGGWIMVRAEENTPRAIMAAIKAGDFYASTGPDIYDVRRNDNVISVQCSPADSVAFTGQSFRGMVVRPAEGQDTLTEAAYRIREEWFIRVTVTDATGRMAWSQPLFLP